MSISPVAFAPNSQTLAISNNFTVELWNVKDIKASPPQRIPVLSGHQAEIVAIAISPDGQTIASAADDKTIKLWNIEGKHSIALWLIRKEFGN